MYVIGDEELQALRDVFSRKKLFRYQAGGGECDAFESEFASKLGTSHALMVTSGTNALVAALTAARIGSGDEVIVPAYTFVATAAAVLLVGAVPVIANVDDQLGMDPADVRRKLSVRTKGIIPVHMDGLSCDIEGLVALAKERGLVVIEDVAQAIGGSYRGQRLGTWGDLGCFSLNENKNISCGEGGIVVTRDRELYERAYCIHDASARYNPVAKHVFQRTQPFLGSSMRVSEVLGAIMRVQLRRLDDILARLRERKKLLRGILGQTNAARVIRGHCEEGDCGSSVHLNFSDPQAALLAGREMRSATIPCFPIVLRPAHVCWKWDLPGVERAADFLDSVGLLSSTLRLEVDPAMSLEDTKLLGEKMMRILEAARVN